jgi:hypothetical protein
MEQRTAWTTNMDVAAFLALRGLELLEVDAAPARARFVFSDPEACADRLVDEYWRSAFCRFVSRRMELRRTLRRACSTFEQTTFADSVKR